jgi:hypothetical protein
MKLGRSTLTAAFSRETHVAARDAPEGDRARIKATTGDLRTEVIATFLRRLTFLSPQAGWRTPMSAERFAAL